MLSDNDQEGPFSRQEVQAGVTAAPDQATAAPAFIPPNTCKLLIDHSPENYAALRTSLYLSRENASVPMSRIPTPWKGITTDGIPLISQILVSQSPSLTKSIAMSSTFQTTITGSYQAGRDRLLAFFKELSGYGLFEPADLEKKVDRLASVLNGVNPIPRSISLDITRSATASQNSTSPLTAAKQIFDDIQDIDGLIGRYIDYFRQLKAAGQVPAMWSALGLTFKDIARWTSPELPVPLPPSHWSSSTSDRAGNNVDRQFWVQRPGGVTTVCVLEIVTSILSILLLIILFPALATLASDPRAGVLGTVLIITSLLAIVSAIAVIVTSVNMLNGSWMARRVFTVLTVIGWVINLSYFWMGRWWQFFLSLIVQAILLRALYTDLANRYFGQRATKTARSEEYPAHRATW